MNLHYQFWVDYYDLFEDKSVMSMPEGNEKDEKIKKTIQRKNHELVNSKWKLLQEEVPLFGDMQTLAFKVLYPGLLMGLGYEHSTDLVKDAPKIALGMSLDYTTGLPVIPGSEAKGMLRSAFIGSKDLIKGYLAEVKEEFSQLTDQEIHALEVDIFGHTHTYDTDFKPSKEAEEGHGKDIFFDAFPKKKKKNGHLIGLENITSHISYDPDLKENPRMYQGLTDPNPITLLKVMPDVVFLFRFKLCDSEITVNNKTVSITAEQKLKLFENIITDFGMGAKTNVGFGLLEKTTEKPPYCYLFSAGSESNLTSGQNETPTDNSTTVQSQSERPKAHAAFVVGQEYTATVTDVAKNNLKLMVTDENGNAAHPAYKRDGISESVRKGEKDLSKVFAKGETWRVRCDGTESTENGTLKHQFTLIGKQEGST